MSFDLDKLQAIAELGEVIRLQNEALERLAAFRKARPYLMMPNLARMVEENIKENVTVLYKELNNLHKPPTQQVRYICKECQMAFLVSLPGGICDECRARLGSKPRDYTVPELKSDDEEIPQSIPDESELSASESPMADNETESPEVSEPATRDSSTGENHNLASEVAEEVAHDLSVLESGDTQAPISSSSETARADEENVCELSMADDEIVYELSLDDETDLSMPIDPDSDKQDPPAHS